MKRSTGMVSLTLALALAVAWPKAGTAGEKEWATTGKILTGVIVASLFAPFCASPQPAYTCPPVVYTPPPVYFAPPPMYAPPPVVYAPPVYVAPPPVYVAPPVMVVPPVWGGAVFYYRSGYGGGDCRGGSDWHSRGGYDGPRGGYRGPGRWDGGSRHR